MDMDMGMWCSQKRHENNGQAVHHHVKCDVCGIHPIRGIRYKCTVCEDYDLCESCESSGKHDLAHPLVKMARPFCRQSHLGGLREMVGNKHCHRRFPWRMRRHPCERDSFHCARRNMESHGIHRAHHDRKSGGTHCTRHNMKSNGIHCAHRNMKLNDVQCVCGVSLVKTTPIEAYGHSEVTCDWCEMNCSRDPFIFHCPVAKCMAHPSGFDVCFKCASKCQNNTTEPLHGVDEMNDPFASFPYADQARSLVEMGFTDKERIMFCLVSKKGNLNQVIAELLSPSDHF
jgi:hypothetical protein